MAREPIAVRGFSIDTRPALALASRIKGEALRAAAAIEAANTQLARDFQFEEARRLNEAVVRHGRPQRHGAGNRYGLARNLVDPRNRTVTPQGFTVNNEEFLDSAAIYWRQLEHGFSGRTQELHGLFAEPRRGIENPGAHYRSTAGLSPPRPGDRSANRFQQFWVNKHGVRAPAFRAAVGPRDPYRYIATASRDTRDYWANTARVRNVYQRAFLANGLDLLAHFRALHGGSALKGSHLIGNPRVSGPQY